MSDQVAYALAQTGQRKQLAIIAPGTSPYFAGFIGARSSYNGQMLFLGPLSSENAASLRTRLTWLSPQPLGMRTSVGLGDRLGLATPAHVRAVRTVGGSLAPVFAQQSIREMQRTGRSPQEVIDDATWGVFGEGWDGGFGADADHVKTTGDISSCVGAGYTMFSLDPGDEVHAAAETLEYRQLIVAFRSLPWNRLEDSPEGLAARYIGQSFDVEALQIHFDEETLLRAAVKYGSAVARTTEMYRHLAQATTGRSYEVEVSVDETASPTSHHEHVFIARELHRLGVRWVSLAPRYIGRFEKAVDYIGQLQPFEADFSIHSAIARRFGPYKLAIHSGSDKHRIHESAAQLARGLIHLKTSGTTYLEALRTVSLLDPDLFRAIYRFARRDFESAKSSYQISASLEQAPVADGVPDSDLPSLLDNGSVRQILHVTYGGILSAPANSDETSLGGRLKDLLTSASDLFIANLQAHLATQLAPFAAAAKGRSLS